MADKSLDDLLKEMDEACEEFFGKWSATADEVFEGVEVKKKEKEEGSIRKGLPLSPPYPLYYLLKELLQEVREIKKKIYAQIPSNPASEPPKSEPKQAVDTEPFREEFEILWSKFPRKQGKKDALRHYIAARKQNIPFKTINDGLDRYIDYIRQNGIEPTFVKYGSSWFCEWGWQDDYSGNYRKQSGRRENLSDEEAERIAREVLYGSD